MNAVLANVRQLVDVELAAANERFPQFHSQHEGWAVLKEEAEEAEEEVSKMKLLLECAWGNITSDLPANEDIRCLKQNAINAACEAIQAAAMCQKFLDMEGSIHYDGSDTDIEQPIIECEHNAAYIETTQNWTGYDLSEEEMLETITCPHCKQFPFKSKEIQVYDVVRVVCFKTEEGGQHEE